MTLLILRSGLSTVPLGAATAPTTSPTGSSVQTRCFGRFNPAAKPADSDVAEYKCSGNSDECV